MVEKIGIVGAGLIGRGWAVIFADAGFEVQLYDQSRDAVRDAMSAVLQTITDLNGHGLLRQPGSVAQRISVTDSLQELTRRAGYIQECAWESADVKRRIFLELDSLAAPDAILASSCSTIPPDEFLLVPRNPSRCLVAHPFNPPNLIPLVEIVPSSSTSSATIERTLELLKAIGQEPIVVRKPVVGYAVNRLQAVVIAEAINLVAKGVLAPADVDKCMKFGLGRRWAFIGPFETMDLNAHDGFLDYVSKYYEAAYRPMLEDIDIKGRWSTQAVEAIESWRRSEAPDAPAIAARRMWRDRMLARLAVLLGRERA